MFTRVKLLGGLVPKGNIPSNIDIDTISTSCVYSVVNKDIITGVDKFGILFTIANDSAGSGYNRFQRYVASISGEVYYRLRENETWLGWRRIASSAV